MHFPTYKRIRVAFQTKFWPESSDGAAIKTDGSSDMAIKKDKQGNPHRFPVFFSNTNPKHVRFSSRRKCLQWLQKMKLNYTIQSEPLFIHAKF